MTNIRYAYIVAILCLLLLAFPLTQLVLNSGMVFYTNALDELVYLQYEHARLFYQHYNRFSQLLIISCHKLGISAGQINLVLDFISLIIFFILVKKIGIALFKEHSQAKLFALLVFLVPLLVNAVNPIINTMGASVVSSELLYWVTMPFYKFVPLLRTPEPQLSYLLILIFTLLCLRLKNILPLFVILPFSYSFIGLPLSFVGLAIFIHKQLKVKSIAACTVLATLALALVGISYLHFLISDEAQLHLVFSRMPLVSVTGLFSIAAYISLRKQIPDNLKSVLFFLAISPLVASNIHILTGFFAQPNNVEDYWGIYIFAIIIAVPMCAQKSRALFVISVGICLLLFNSLSSFQENTQRVQKISLRPETLAKYRDNTKQLLSSDPYQALLLSHLFPQQAATPLGQTNIYFDEAENSFENYLCIRKALLSEQSLALQFKSMIEYMDHLYIKENKDHILNTIRRKTIAPIRSIDTRDIQCDLEEYLIVDDQDGSLASIRPSLS